MERTLRGGCGGADSNERLGHSPDPGAVHTVCVIHVWCMSAGANGRVRLTHVATAGEVPSSLG